MKCRLKMALIFAVVVFLALAAGCGLLERRMLFFPSHHDSDGVFQKWVVDGRVIGVARRVAAPRNVWLLMHGNAGQAADREYALGCFSDEDAVFVLEYPGFGRRAGKPSMASMNAAAKEGYLTLRRDFPKAPLCVAGESIGTGPASYLATLEPAPDKVALVVPFDVLANVARDHVPGLMVRLLLKQNWNNVESLSKFRGPVEIFAAEEDSIVQPKHARALAAAAPNSRITVIEGGHNDWSDSGKVKFRNP